MDIQELLKYGCAIESRDMEVLLRTVLPYKPKTILEIGTYNGRSAKLFSMAFDPTLLITVDIDKIPDNAVVINQPTYHYLWGMDSRSKETVQKVISLLKGREVDFLFIDGGHLYENVLIDYLNYSPLVKQGGIIGFHDIQYIHELAQVKLLWDKLKQQYFYIESCVGEASTGLGILFKEQNNSAANMSLYNPY